jgi:hypothetical protein
MLGAIPSVLLYVFMAWCLVKYFYLSLYEETRTGVLVGNVVALFEKARSWLVFPERRQHGTPPSLSQLSTWQRERPGGC